MTSCNRCGVARITALAETPNGLSHSDLEARRTKGYRALVILEQHPDIQRLSPSEKLALVTELWDDLAAHPADVPVTGEEITELDRRMEEYRKDPTKLTTWEAIKRGILGSAA